MSPEAASACLRGREDRSDANQGVPKKWRERGVCVLVRSSV